MPFSSADFIRAVERQGFSKSGGKGKRGAHRTWTRPGAPGERHNTVTIVLNQREIPKSTLASMLRQLGINEATLRDWMK